MRVIRQQICTGQQKDHRQAKQYFPLCPSRYFPPVPYKEIQQNIRQQGKQHNKEKPHTVFLPCVHHPEICYCKRSCPGIQNFHTEIVRIFQQHEPISNFLLNI